MKEKLHNPVKVSVIMPSYNCVDYIHDTIDSVLEQNYDDFELLIADDCSRDNTWDTLQQYKDHPKIRLYRNKVNLGAGATRNILVKLARGEYISPCDADDIMLQGNFRRLTGYLDSHPETGVVYADILIIELKAKEYSKTMPMIFGRDLNKNWELITNHVNHAGSMIRKELITRVGGYDENAYSIDDYSLWLKLSEIAKFKYLEDEVYYVYRRHPASLTRTDKSRFETKQRLIREAIKRRYGFDF